jgi:mono/diheme cytochrome c family protein
MSILRNLSLTLLATSVLGLCLSCGGDEKTDTTTGTDNTTATETAKDTAAGKPAVDTAAGKAIYQMTCLPCHGETGIGDGVAAAALDPKPRDMSDAAWQSSVDDAYIAKVFMEGGAAVGKSPLMAAFAAVIPDDAAKDSLVAYIRSLEK